MFTEMAAEPNLCASVSSEHTKEVLEQYLKNILWAAIIHFEPFIYISDQISSKTGDIFYRFL